MFMMRALPSLNLLAAFECAARHLSFTRAARELNVQQPAVSRQVAALEQELGTALFSRTKPLLTLTREGQDLQAAVSKGLTGIRQCVDGIRDAHKRDVLVVNAAIGLTSLFLMPRLGAFQAANPDIGLEVVTRDQNAGFDATASDVVFTFGEAGLPDTTSRLILEEELYAVCVPSLLPDHGPLSPEALVEQRLLHMTSADHAGDWNRFLHGTGLTASPPGPLDRFYSFMVYLHAIENGNGIGLGWAHITDALVATGRLTLACDRRVRTGRGYYCCVMPQAMHRKDAKIFLDWLNTPD